jgi:hypothetical protein
LYVIVSYTIKTFDGIDNLLTMNVSLYYVSPDELPPGTSKHIFVNHEFILGKGISCHDIYEDIFRNNGYNNRPIIDTVDPALPILLYLKKTLCDWLQNFLKIQYHTLRHPRLGFFVKIKNEPTLLEIRNNPETLPELPLLFSNYSSPIIFNTIENTTIGEIINDTNGSQVRINGLVYSNYNVFNSINIYWNHFRPTYSPKHFRYFNVSCDPYSPSSSICFTNDILDFCFSVSLSFLTLKANPPPPELLRICNLPAVQVDLTSAIGVIDMGGGSNHNNHKRKRKISFSNTKKRFRKYKTIKKNVKKSSKKQRKNKKKSTLNKKKYNK